ncbi:hypothetical protein MKX01_037212 [Papaver californicum]|nr:hypothetical protein MKX01_037212 [Papaver californicum]
MVTTTATTTTSNSIHSSSTSNGLSNNANMNSTNNRNAPAAAGARVTGLAATSSVWANIVKGEPNVVVAAPPPISSPKKAASSSSSSSVSQVNQKIDSSSVADDSNTTDVKSASTSSSKSSCNHNDDNINCTSDGATIMGITEKEPSGSPSSHTASDSAVADTNAATPAASTPSTTTASVKKPAAAAWKKPSFNGTTTANAEAGLVIGDAFSWPALSESANNNVRGSTKSPSPSPTPSYPPSPLDSSLKPVSLSQISHVATSSSQTQKQSTNHANHNPTSNHASSNRQRSTKRGTNTTSNSSGAVALMNGGLPSQSQSSSAGVSAEKPQKNSSGTPASTVPDPSMKDSSHKMNNLERGSKGRGGFAPQPDQSSHQHNSSFRRGSGGPHPRGDGHGSYRQNQNHMGRREHDHRDWNSHRSFNGRDAQQHQQMHPRMGNPRNNYIRPPPGNVNGAFIAPPQPVPLRPFGNAMGYPDMPSPVYFVPDPLRGVPFIPAAPLPMFFPGADPNLYSTIARQIEYYFSSVNLCKDIYLRQNMDEQGWVPVSLISGFHRVEQLMKGIPNNIQFILDAVRASTIVETKGDMIRKRNDWMNWILPTTAINFAPIPVPQSVGVPKNGNSTNPDMNNHLQSSNGEGTSEGTH